tara:strand:+ start:1786 stop:2118 length:333 start_codon:yes stop_codon:yes gene_type:complete
MAVVEYKLHVINNQGHMATPPWIQDGGNWYNAADKTMVGWILAEADREYWVPDNITTLTKEELNTRMLAIHATNPFDKGDEMLAKDRTVMTDAEVTTMSNDWYDAYILGK